MIRSITLHDCAEGIFEKFEKDVRADMSLCATSRERKADERRVSHLQVAWDIWECQIPRTQQLYGRALEQCVVLFAHESRVFNRFVADIMHVGAGADDADVVWMRGEGVERDVSSSAPALADSCGPLGSRN